MAEPEVSAPISVEHDGWTIFANDGVTSESDITSALGAESSPADDAPLAPVSEPAEDAPAPVEAKDGLEPPAEEPEAEAKPAEDAKPKRELTAKEQKREAQARINAAVSTPIATGERVTNLEKATESISNAVKSIDESLKVLTRLDMKHDKMRDGLGRAFKELEDHESRMRLIEKEMPTITLVRGWAITGAVAGLGLLLMALVGLVLK